MTKLIVNNTRNKLLNNNNYTKTNEDIQEEYLKTYNKMCLDLNLYQDKLKRDKDLYKEEFEQFMIIFKPIFYEFLESPSKSNDKINDILIFLAHISHLYPCELAFIPNELVTLIENNYNIINQNIRITIIEYFNLLRKKDILEPTEILPMMFQLLCCQDKELRRKVERFIINDLSRINSNVKNNKINKYIKNKCTEMLNLGNNKSSNNNYNISSFSNERDNTSLLLDKKAARKTLKITITLFKKGIWNDDKTINIISSGCYNDDDKLCLAACNFFLSEDNVDINEKNNKHLNEDDDSSFNEMDDLKNKYKLLGGGNSKKTKKKKMKLKKLMKAVERRETRKSNKKGAIKSTFLPINLLHDPQTICERMFDKLKSLKKCKTKSSNLKYKLMRLIGRISGRYKIVIPNFFAYLCMFISPRQDNLSSVFAALAEANHQYVLPVDIEPVVDQIFDRFIDSSFPPLYITLGVNAITALVEKNNNSIEKKHYDMIMDLFRVKNKSVHNSIKGFNNLVKDVIPDIKNKKYNYTIQDNLENSFNNSGIEGIDLLKKHEGIDDNYAIECNEFLTDKQLKKIKILKLKENAEAIQKIRLKLNSNDVNIMAGDDVKINKKVISKKHEEDEDDEDDEEDEEVEDDEEDEEVEDNEEEYDDDNVDEESYKSHNDNIEEIDEESDVNDHLNELLDDVTSKSSNNNNEDNLSDSEENTYNSKDDIVDESKFNTFKEKRGVLKKQKDDKIDFKLNRKKKKKGQKTNFESRKNKPTQMVIHKIRNKQNKKNDKNLTHKIKNLKRQLGRFKRGNMVLNKKNNKKSKKEIKATGKK